MSTGPKGSWGGKRPGAGRKKITLNEREVKALLKDARKRARETGKAVNEILLDIIYSGVEGIDSSYLGDVKVRDRLAALRIYKEFSVMQTKAVDGKERYAGPVIGLPETLPDPAKQVPFGKEVKQNITI